MCVAPTPQVIPKPNLMPLDFNRLASPAMDSFFYYLSLSVRLLLSFLRAVFVTVDAGAIDRNSIMLYYLQALAF